MGCLPVLPRFFKHLCSREADTSSRLGILPSMSWRRLFRRSASPEARSKDSSYYYHKFLGKEKASSSTESTEAPHIETLNLTRITLPSIDGDLPKVPLQARHTEYSSVAPWTTTRHTKRDEYEGHETTGNIESAIPTPWK